ncbi:MAG: hypothetical protein PHR58_06140, partial [Sphaerochaetaceae bacterium]|nr:hypothetical protein [Sphaerochaetaceae bacterium]
MDTDKILQVVKEEIAKNGGLLRLKPSWVARTFLDGGKRLGLKDEQYDVGERGMICERWLGSETQADNEVKHPNEGLSYINLKGHEILLRDAVKAAGG